MRLGSDFFKSAKVKHTPHLKIFQSQDYGKSDVVIIVPKSAARLATRRNKLKRQLTNLTTGIELKGLMAIYVKRDPGEESNKIFEREIKTPLYD